MEVTMNGPIVVGTDGSVTAAVAVRAATILATTVGQPLHVVCADHLRHVVTRPDN
jgi:hypothetical protein